MAASTSRASGKIGRYPLYNTTYTLFRLAPLYRGNSSSTIFDPTVLALHARSFHNLLKGDVLRGVRVGLGTAQDDDGLSRVGALTGCQWRVLGDEDDWIAEETRRISQGQEDEPSLIGGQTADDPRAIYVTVEYERATYTALLLRDPRDNEPDEEDGFSNLPLAFIRMPVGLKDTFTNFLQSTFDTYAAPLKLSSDFVLSSLERYASDLAAGSPTNAADAVEEYIRDVQIVLGFGTQIAPLLKTIDVTIPRHDIWNLMRQGRAIFQNEGLKDENLHLPASSKLSRQKDVNGGDLEQLPLTAALGLYLHEHLALDISSKEISVNRVACGAFTLGAEGKLKLLQGSDLDGEVGTAIGNFMARLFNRTRKDDS